MITKIETDKAPKAIGPYSQGIKAGNLLYISGQLPINPTTGKIVDGTIKEQTEQVIDNIEAILKSANVNLSNVIKSEVFLKDMNDFKIMNEVYSSRFVSDPKPARQAVEVARLPLDVKIEISCIAYIN